MISVHYSATLGPADGGGLLIVLNAYGVRVVELPSGGVLRSSITALDARLVSGARFSSIWPSWGLILSSVWQPIIHQLTIGAKVRSSTTTTTTTNVLAGFTISYSESLGIYTAPAPVQVQVSELPMSLLTSISQLAITNAPPPLSLGSSAMPSEIGVLGSGFEQALVYNSLMCEFSTTPATSVVLAAPIKPIFTDEDAPVSVQCPIPADLLSASTRTLKLELTAANGKIRSHVDIDIDECTSSTGTALQCAGTCLNIAESDGAGFTCLCPPGFVDANCFTACGVGAHSNMYHNRSAGMCVPCPDGTFINSNCTLERQSGN